MDLGTGSGSKIFQLNDEDIELIVRLLHQECDHHVYHQDAIRNPDKEYFICTCCTIIHFHHLLTILSIR